MLPAPGSSKLTSPHAVISNHSSIHRIQESFLTLKQHIKFSVLSHPPGSQFSIHTAVFPSMAIREEEMRIGKGGDGGKEEVGEQQTR